LFYVLENVTYTGIDNSSGGAWKKSLRAGNMGDERSEFRKLVSGVKNEKEVRLMTVVLASTENMDYAEWLNLRKKGIGGSDASVICGVNRWKSPIELWMEKTDKSPYQEAGEAAYWGTQLESLVRNEFTKRTGIEVSAIHQLLQSKEHPFMLANLDGTCQHSDSGTCVFEAKTASAYKAGEWNNAIPDEYTLQVQHYMAVTGYKGCCVAVLIGGNSFRWKFVERDEELIEMLIQLEAQFWDCVKSDVPPPLDGSEASVKFMAQRFPDSVPGSKIELPPNAAELIRQYDEACEQLKRIEEQKQEAENLLKQMLGDNETGITVNRVITWKSVSQERLDSKTLKAEHPALYKKYTNTSSHRRFYIKAIA
jgi:putative phage-type endonuclease